MGKATTKAKDKYDKKNYKRWVAKIRFDLDDNIQSYLDAEGISRAKFLERAIQKLTE